MQKQAPLLRHIQDGQDLAVKLHGVLVALFHVDGESSCADAATSLITVAKDMANDLQKHLDTVSLPKSDSSEAGQ